MLTLQSAAKMARTEYSALLLKFGTRHAGEVTLALVADVSCGDAGLPASFFDAIATQVDATQPVDGRVFLAILARLETDGFDSYMVKKLVHKHFKIEETLGKASLVELLQELAKVQSGSAEAAALEWLAGLLLDMQERRGLERHFRNHKQKSDLGVLLTLLQSLMEW